MSDDNQDNKNIARPTAILFVIAIVVVVLVLGQGGGGGLNKQSNVSMEDLEKAAQAPAENPGLSGVSEKDRYDIEMARKAPSGGETTMSPAEEKAFMDAAAMPAQQ